MSIANSNYLIFEEYIYPLFCLVKTFQSASLLSIKNLIFVSALTKMRFDLRL